MQNLIITSLAAIYFSLKCFISRHRWTWGDTTDSPLTRLGMAPAATNMSCFKEMPGQN